MRCLLAVSKSNDRSGQGIDIAASDNGPVRTGGAGVACGDALAAEEGVRFNFLVGLAGGVAGVVVGLAARLPADLVILLGLAIDILGAWSPTAISLMRSDPPSPAHAHSSSVNSTNTKVFHRSSITLSASEKTAAISSPDLEGVETALLSDKVEETELQDMGGSSSEWSRGRYGAPVLQPHESPAWYRRNKKIVILLGAAALLLLGYAATHSASSTRLIPASESNTDFEGMGSEEIAQRPADQQLDNPNNQNNKNQCLPVPGKPEHQFALMIDAGSTGSRIHI